MSTEVSVIGVVNNELYQTVLNRLGNHTHSFSHFTSQEIGFDRGSFDTASEDSNILRLKHTIRKPEISNNHSPLNFKNPIRNGWTLTSLGRIEPERLSPDFSIRPFYFCPILAGNPIEFVGALGYRRKFEYFRRGVQFLRGGVIIEIFRVYHNEHDETPMAGPEGHVITITAIIPTAARTTPTTTTTTTTTAAAAAASTATAAAVATSGATNTNAGAGTAVSSSGATVQELRSEACARVREIQAILKGLADLGRVEPA
ncbi:hypothetical protein PCASD_20497 [Puccinia coronata f. sp. avenae]|uniref:Mediator of RNA polymerase II transcription subunit 18 n=1 Tax=Puccinia coronata f. sp. avenae TaxID=200324 RepID=A0A2N5SS57_9BASI|nr:hypothetical protein PCASD_20497 [Puccinia coronata f. sp. avenae]